MSLTPPDLKEAEEFLQTWKPALHHILSYDRFVYHYFPELLSRQRLAYPVSKDDPSRTCMISFHNIWFSPPGILQNGHRLPITPLDCRQKNLPYHSLVYGSVLQEHYTNGVLNGSTCIRRALICQVPLMIGSQLCTVDPKHVADQGECINDPQGYFIIDGQEKVLVTQQRECYNLPQVTSLSSGETQLKVRSMSDETQHSVAVYCHLSKSKFTITLPYLKSPVPMGIVLTALGVSFERLWEELGIENPEMKKTLRNQFEGYSSMSASDALMFIGMNSSRKATAATAPVVVVEEEDEVIIEDDEEELIPPPLHIPSDDEESIPEVADVVEENVDAIEYGNQVLQTEMFPHLGVGSSLSTKVDYLVFLIRRLVLVHFNVIPPDNRDNIMFKRYENSGLLLKELYQVFLKNFYLNTKEVFLKNNNTLSDYTSLLNEFLTKHIKQCFKTGNWGPQKNTYVRQGVSQMLKRLSYMDTLSHIQRLAVPVGKEGKNAKIRQIHPSTFGFIDPYETPEGKPCGIVMNFALVVRVSSTFSILWIRDALFKFSGDLVSLDRKGAHVWINNTLRFSTPDPLKLLERLREMRIRGILPNEVGFFVEEFGPLKEVHIYCDGGRLLRPLFRTHDNQITWLDSNEIQYTTVAMYPSEQGFEYREIHPCFLLGICTGSIPFTEHMQSPRCVYEASMMKQSIGLYATNYKCRYDTSSELLAYPQRSIVSTVTSRAVRLHEMPAGTNCIVAIASKRSENAEDSLVINKGAIDRGLFTSFSYKTLTLEQYKGRSTDTMKRIIGLPPMETRKPNLNYDLLDQDGVVRFGVYVHKKDVVLGRMSADQKEDFSEVSEEEGYVEKIESHTVNGYSIFHITLKQLKVPECGDKFANLSAQKGTCSTIVSPEDMPFTAEGIVPDIMINSHAMPSRMTISMFLEMVLGKKACMDGQLKDATSFSSSSLDIEQWIDQLLGEHGFDRYGWETMYNGETGEPLRCRVFIGSCYYQKLKHMVTDKMHARAVGNVTMLTRQPLAGRSKEGGLRVGEMERDCIISHGSVSFLHDRLFTMSDKYYAYICALCGEISNHKDHCHKCKNAECYLVNLPYAAKLLIYLLRSTGLGCKFKLEQI